MPKFYIESGDWKTITISSDSANAVLQSLKELINVEKKVGLSDIIAINEGGFISDLFNSDQLFEDGYIDNRRKKHIFIKNLRLSLLKSFSKDIIIFFPTKKILDLLGCDSCNFQYIKDNECNELNIME